ncbi:MAG: TIGR02996 domain-containing protein [Myxococcaceae bacterium]|nr:TIGR02996 domain-containing protein [Myxococcaceae bacterium]
MTREATLLAALAAQVDDEATWSVYADWLVEQGDPRGELVQLQRLLRTADVDDERRPAAEKQVKALLEQHRVAWLAPVQEFLSLGLRFGFDRGVVAEVQGEPRLLARHAHALLAAAPLLTRLSAQLEDQVRELAPLAGTPLLERARFVSVDSFTASRWKGAEVLAQAEHLEGLRFVSVAIGAGDLEGCFGPGKLTGLTTFEVSGCRLNRGALEPLATLDARLERLELQAAHLGPWLGKTLARPAFHGLRVLAAAGNELGREGLEALLPALRQVESLDLRGNALTADDLGLLLAPGVLPKVRVLELGGNALGDDGARALARWPQAAQLTRLHLGDARVTNEGALALAEAPGLSGLRSLVLSGPRFSASTDAALAASAHLARARIFSGNRVLPREKPAPRKKAAPRAKRR